MENVNCLPLLRGLLSYHERAVCAQKPCPLAFSENGCSAAKASDGSCCNTLQDVYAEGLREAIRCAEIVYGMSDGKDTLSTGLE